MIYGSASAEIEEMKKIALLAPRALLWSLPHLGFVFLHLLFYIKEREPHSYPAVN